MQYIALYTVFWPIILCLSHFESSRAESKFLSQVEIFRLDHLHWYRVLNLAVAENICLGSLSENDQAQK